MFGHKVQLHNLLAFCYHASSVHPKVTVRKMSATIKHCEPCALPGNNFIMLLGKIDTIFYSVIKSSYSDFDCLSDPLLSTKRVNYLATDCEKLLPNHYSTMQQMLKCNR